MGEESWEILNKKFNKDHYVDWNKQAPKYKDISDASTLDENTDAVSLAQSIITRK